MSPPPCIWQCAVRARERERERDRIVVNLIVPRATCTYRVTVIVNVGRAGLYRHMRVSMLTCRSSSTFPGSKSSASTRSSCLMTSRHAAHSNDSPLASAKNLALCAVVTFPTPSAINKGTALEALLRWSAKSAFPRGSFLMIRRASTKNLMGVIVNGCGFPLEPKGKPVIERGGPHWTGRSLRPWDSLRSDRWSIRPDSPDGGPSSGGLAWGAHTMVVTTCSLDLNVCRQFWSDACCAG